MSEQPGFFARRAMRRELKAHGVEIDKRVPISEQHKAWQTRETNHRVRDGLRVREENARESLAREIQGTGWGVQTLGERTMREVSHEREMPHHVSMGAPRPGRTDKYPRPERGRDER